MPLGLKLNLDGKYFALHTRMGFYSECKLTDSNPWAGFFELRSAVEHADSLKPYSLRFKHLSVRQQWSTPLDARKPGIFIWGTLWIIHCKPSSLIGLLS